MRSAPTWRWPAGRTTSSWCPATWSPPADRATALRKPGVVGQPGARTRQQETTPALVGRGRSACAAGSDAAGDLDRGAVGNDLLVALADLVRVEPHREDGVGASAVRLVDEALDGLLTGLHELLAQALELAADDRLEAGPELGTDVPRPHGQPGDLAEHLGDVVSRQVVHRGDQHGRSLPHRIAAR